MRNFVVVLSITSKEDFSKEGILEAVKSAITLGGEEAYRLALPEGRVIKRLEVNASTILRTYPA